MEKVENVKITFLNVDQGDSIIVSWSFRNKNHIGIIDCSLNNLGANPVVDYLKYQELYCIEFLILSHPHLDHYSGMFELLSFCENHNIFINNFIHTYLTDVNFIKHYNADVKSHNLFVEILKKLDTMYDAEIILNYDGLGGGVNEVKTFEGLPFEFLSPTYAEIKEFTSKYNAKSILRGNNPMANYLSTMIRVLIDKTYFILTADSESYSFKRINRKMQNVMNDGYQLCQVAHHGSIRNYVKTFWEKNKFDGDKIAVFSVGKRYRHPSIDIVKSLRNLGYKIYSTNIVGGLISDIESNLETESFLDWATTLIETYKTNNKTCYNVKSGNQVFIFKEGRFINL